MMRRRRREMVGLNTTSTADISFMLLVFFLVTSSMDTDKGMERLLPPPQDNTETQEVEVKKR
ncbi:MAG: biopolymer transporter ExbD, partial [Prevotella sp.]|nr:biopolymer transporter ExbD [Prevotella sp.]